MHVRAIGECWTRYGGKPSIAYAELLRQTGQHRQLLSGKTFHNAMSILRRETFAFVAPHEASHDRILRYRSKGIAIELCQSVEAGVPWIRRKVACVICIVRNLGDSANGVRVRFAPAYTIDGPIRAGCKPQHVVKRAVLHHQHHDVLEVIQSGWRHSPPTAIENVRDSLGVVTEYTRSVSPIWEMIEGVLLNFYNSIS